jgi:predicted cupin superfamily sugar epimerase
VSSARELIDRLGLKPHPEGGWYREIFRSAMDVQTTRGPRSSITTIYYMLEAGQQSRWHVVDSDEIWHFYCGDPLELLAYRPETRQLERTILDSPHKVENAVSVIEAGVWQAARPLGEYALVGCSVGPGFDFGDFHFVAGRDAQVHHFIGEMARYADLL